MNLQALCLALLLFSPALRAASVTIQGAQTNQVIEGFGVNANYRSWNGSELRPVLDAFIDQAGMTLFRVTHDLADWEATNDDADPEVINWPYYNTVYGSTEFRRLWDMFAYLKSRGITNGAFFNFMGWGPAWMMGSDGRTLKAGMEGEWAEMITSALAYARDTRRLRFSLIAPNNEPDIYHEGIRMDAATYVNALHQLAVKLDRNGLGDLRFIGPDRSGGGTGYLPEMMADPVVMTKLKHFGVHSYAAAGAGSTGVRSFLTNSAYPDRTFWMTEFNVWCSTCDNGNRGNYDWSYTRGTADYMLQHLLNGASACFPWEGYDSYYAHHGAWGFWGLFAVDNENAATKTYTPRKNFYTVAQISKWVRPGAQRINVTGTPSPFTPLLAFRHSGLGQITIVGINTSGSAATLNGTLASLPIVPFLKLFYTSATTNLANGGSVPVNNGRFSASIPADCVFTLTGNDTNVAAVFSQAQGSYNGLFQEADQVRQASAGFLSTVLTSRGTYSGRLQIGAARYSFSGKLDPQCQATNVILRPRTNALILEFQIGSAEQAGRIFGRVSDGVWLAALSGDRAVFNSPKNPSPYSGSYTMRIPGQVNGHSFPMGDGDGTVRVDAGGRVRFAGTLADGTRVSQGVPLSPVGLWPLYVPLYSGSGSLLSWLGFTNRAEDDLSGSLSWIKPADGRARYYAEGFTNQTAVVGSIYQPPLGVAERFLNLTNAEVAFSGENASANFTNSVTLGPYGRVSNWSVNRLTMNFSPTTGTFMGGVMNPATGRWLPFSGVGLQKLSRGYGFLLGVNQSSRVTLSP